MRKKPHANRKPLERKKSPAAEPFAFLLARLTIRLWSPAAPDHACAPGYQASRGGASARARYRHDDEKLGSSVAILQCAYLQAPSKVRASSQILAALMKRITCLRGTQTWHAGSERPGTRGRTVDKGKWAGGDEWSPGWRHFCPTLAPRDVELG